LTKHISAPEHDINNRKRNISLQGLLFTCPQIWWTLVLKRLRTVGEFLPTSKFSHWETLPALSQHIADSRQTLARVMQWYELTV